MPISSYILMPSGTIWINLEPCLRLAIWVPCCWCMPVIVGIVKPETTAFLDPPPELMLVPTVLLGKGNDADPTVPVREGVLL
jgi:hypothetical protein